jgi:hypothetical protein
MYGTASTEPLRTSQTNWRVRLPECAAVRSEWRHLTIRKAGGATKRSAARSQVRPDLPPGRNALEEQKSSEPSHANGLQLAG